MFIKITRSVKIPALVAVCITDEIYQLSDADDVVLYCTSDQRLREINTLTNYNTLEEVISDHPSAISVYEGDEVTFKFG
jgi:predicted nucleic acid-binding protein